MFNAETITTKGNLTIVLTNEHGQIIEEKNVDNLVVTTGRNWIAGRLTDATSNSQMSYVAIGEGTVAPVLGNTILGSEKQRVLVVPTVAANVVTYSATFPPTSNIAVTEAGIFNASGANNGTMLCRTTFPVVNKGTADSMSITWTLSIS
jgi:hypothetical protein